MYRILGIIIIKINQNSKINNPEKSRKGIRNYENCHK